MSRVLIVDDKEDNLYYLETLLKGHGYTVDTARHGAEALVRARQIRPDLVVSDLLMPVMDGYTLLRHWKADADLQPVPFLVYTATYTEAEDERLALSLGADAFILKPAEPEDFLNRVREVEARERGVAPSQKPSRGNERNLLKLYSETLIRKLEEKTLQLEESNRALQQDIVERRKAEEALHLLNSAVLQTKESILITDAELDRPGPRIIFVNPAFTAMTGYTPEEVLGKTPRIFQGPLTDREVIARLRRNLEDGEVFDGEAVNYRKDGSAYIQEWQVAPLRNAAGVITHFVAVQRDITERKRQEDELRWKTAFFEAQVNSALEGILVVDSRGRKILQNKRMSELWKLPDDIAQNEDDAVQVEFVARLTTNPQEFMSGVERLYSHPDEISRAEIELLDGTILDRYSAPVRDGSGEYYGRIWAFRDVTLERTREVRLAEALAREKELAEKARAGERAKSEFLATMSHEIRTPMTGILGFAEMLSQSPTLTEENRDLSQTIVASGEALLRILDDILDFSRIEAGRLVIQTQTFSPRELVHGIQSLFVRQIQERGLEFLVSVEEALPVRWRGDPGRIRQILVNLVGNALKFTERGSIGVRVRRTGELANGEGLEFVVRDTGVGIPPDRADAIFEAFTQADSSISRHHGGAGLGLTISRRLAELMGGTLRLSQDGGEGSTFTLVIPSVLAEATEGVPEIPDVPAIDVEFARRHPQRILVVDDDKVNLKLILGMLRKLGYEPLSARNGTEAVEVFERERPGCIFMDVQMPEMDGMEAARKIRDVEAERKTKSPVFISALTANILPEDRQRCYDAGMDAYLNKPLKIRSIAEMLMEASKFRAGLEA